MAVGFSNNVIYFFVFYLISIGLTAMYMTNDNVNRIKVSNLQFDPLFANENNKAFIYLKNVKKQDCYSLQFFVESKVNVSDIPLVAGLESAIVMCLWKPNSRGIHKIPRVQIQSRFPFGMLQSWSLYRKKGEVLVYPQRIGNSQLPRNKGDEVKYSQSGLFKEHREFQSSDSPRRIDWRVSQKHDQLMVKTFETNQGQSIHLDYNYTLEISDFEKQISQLALWTDIAEKNKMSYSFKFKNFSLPESAGESHYFEILSFLAKVKVDD